MRAPANRAKLAALTPSFKPGGVVTAGNSSPATQRVLKRAGLTLDAMDRIEINEVFASVVLAWERELRPDMARVNVNGAAIALAHPSGARARG